MSGFRRLLNMSLAFTLIDGAACAQEASRILEEAWEPPALRYTPEYLRWQMSFPSVAGAHSAMAFDEDEPVGFAGTSARRLRNGDMGFEAVIVSFVGVRPGWRSRGIAAGLYRTLLGAVAKRGVPVVTFAQAATSGERALLRAYPEAGFRVQPLGICENYGFMGRATGVEGDWRTYMSDDPCVFQAMEAQLIADGEVLWNMPTRGQFEHYLADPRPRKLIAVEHRSTGVRGAGFVVRTELRSGQGFVSITTLDSVWLPGRAAAGLHALLQAASRAWPDSGAMLVTCPNLSGIADSMLSAIRVRKTGSRFSAYFCAAGQVQWPAFERTNLEIV
ncbi:MAG: GNAT family N-acetyltransferase [Terriglobales bacterium]